MSQMLQTELNLQTVITPGNALGGQMGGWRDSEEVPYLQFPGKGDILGPQINAALLLDYFNHGYPANRARNSCELEIRDAFANAGLQPQLETAEREAIMAKP